MLFNLKPYGKTKSLVVLKFCGDICVQHLLILNGKLITYVFIGKHFE